MASFTSISQTKLISYKPQMKKIQNTFKSLSIKYPLHKISYGGLTTKGLTCKKMVLVIKMNATNEADEERYPGESRGFVEEIRQVAIKMHTRQQARGGQREPEGKPVAEWEPALDAYLRFLVDSKLVYETLEGIIAKAEFPEYAEFQISHLERTEKLAKDLEWFKEQGHAIPEPSSPGLTYARELEEISKTDPQALLCHYYNIYFAHSAGGRSIGRLVAEKILNGKELEFYKWDIDLSILLQIAKMKLNKVAQKWTRTEKDRCLEETEKSFKYSEDILQLILS